MYNSILSATQVEFLKLVGATKTISNKFYLTGGTALAGFYIPYRYSEDLDFFSEQEVDVISIQVFLKSISNKLEVSEVEFQSSFNRNLFFLTIKRGAVLKTEFTYFPFTQLGDPEIYENLKIDSVIDIATNKLFTIYQRTAARDYMDLYQLCKKYQYTISDLVANARLKFDSHIDPLKLAAQFNKAPEAIDLPILVDGLSSGSWHKFFQTEADKLQSQILT